MATKGNPTVVVRLPEVERDRWETAAKAQGMSLSAFVRQSVERVMTGPDESNARRMQGAPGRRNEGPGNLTDPRKCTARVRAGSYCRRCGTIHQKGNLG